MSDRMMSTSMRSTEPLGPTSGDFTPVSVFIRVLRWMEHSLGAAFDTAEFARLHGIVNYATSKGSSVILDVHNYGNYYNTNRLGNVALPLGAFSNLWGRLATIYRTNANVVFGLMNEPNGISTETWRDAANLAITAIRRTGATNLILVPGNGYSIAHNWYDSWYGTPNSSVMLTVTDAANNYAFEVHDYFDDQAGGVMCLLSRADGEGNCSLEMAQAAWTRGS